MLYKVIEYSTNRKLVCELLLVVYSNFRCTSLTVSEIQAVV